MHGYDTASGNRNLNKTKPMAKEKNEVDKLKEENEALKKRVQQLEQIVAQAYNSLTDFAYQIRKNAE